MQRDQPWVRYLLGITHVEQAQFADAAASFRKIPLEAGITYLLSRYRLGQVLFAMGDRSAATDALRLVQFSDPLSASALTALADAAIANNEWSKADQLLQRAWLKAPEAGRIATRRAGVLRRLGNAGAAAQWDARANDAEPLVEDPILLIVAEQSLLSSHFLQAANWASGETGTMR